VGAQQPSASAVVRKQAGVTQIPDDVIRVDGHLDEEVWLRAVPVTDFLQKEPDEGAEPTDTMDVRFLADDSALYVGARLSTRNSPEIQSPLGRRDTTGQAESFLISLDTYLDRRTAYTFGVTASGVRLDRYHPSDNEDSFDSGFDPVWHASTSETVDGWIAELWIPFSQLRFNRVADQIWGLNIRRFRPTLDEEDYWVLIPRTERFWSSRFGDLRGISNVPPSRRIEVLPYVASSATVNENRDLSNPFDNGRNLDGRVGADLKFGIGPNLTLDATINPDFGQVEADPAEVNLTAFETRFPEQRPFFLEGAQLFQLDHPNFYYSRRIGAKPVGPITADYVEYPLASTILGAAKLTGRPRPKTSIGVLSAVTGEERAEGFDLDTATTSKVRVGPMAFWNLARFQREFGPSQSTWGFLVNTVHRSYDENDPLADLQSRNALAVAGDTVLRFKRGEYQFRWAGGFSYLNGEPKAVERFQRASSHYAQRPDKDYAKLDPTRTSLSGFSFQTRFERVSGRHWLWNAALKLDTPFFETNDVANFNSADGIMPTAGITYRETTPNKFFRSYSFGLNETTEWNFGGDPQSRQLRPSMNLTWANYWTTSVSFSRNFQTNDASLTRGGPLMEKPRAWSSSVSLGNRSTSPTRWSISTTNGGNEDDGSTHRVSGSVSIRPAPRWQLSASPLYEKLTEPQQYATTITGGGPAATFNNRYIFAFIDRTTISTEFRLGFTLKPDMNLDVYGEPFAASGRYYDFGELMVPGTRERLTYGVAPGTSIVTQPDGNRLVTVDSTQFTVRTRDFNSLSFRSNVVLRWEWRAGSTLYVVWQADRAQSQVLSTPVDVSDMFRSAGAPGNNFFIIKTSFWMPF
jgi:hypothetical protein